MVVSINDFLDQVNSVNFYFRGLCEKESVLPPFLAISEDYAQEELDEFMDLLWEVNHPDREDIAANIEDYQVFTGAFHWRIYENDVDWELLQIAHGLMTGNTQFEGIVAVQSSWDIGVLEQREDLQ